MAFILESSYRCIFVNLFFHYVSPTLTSIPYLSFYLTHRNFQLSKLDFLLYLLCFYFPDGSGGKELAHQYRRLNRCGFNPWVRKIPWRRKWQPTPVSSMLAWIIPWLEEPDGLQSIGLQRVRHNWGDWANMCFPGGSVVKNVPSNAGDVGFIPCVRKIPWSKGLAIHSSILPGEFYGAWRATIQGIAKVRHDWVHLKHTHMYLLNILSIWSKVLFAISKSLPCRLWISFSWLIFLLRVLFICFFDYELIFY